MMFTTKTSKQTSSPCEKGCPIIAQYQNAALRHEWSRDVVNEEWQPAANKRYDDYAVCVCVAFAGESDKIKVYT